MTNATATEGTGFLGAPPSNTAAQRLFDNDLERHGFVMNLSSLWAHQPGLYEGLSALIDQARSAAGVTLRQRAVLITACASALGDSYCSLMWGRRLAGEAGADVAAGVLRGTDNGLDPAEQALARWARTVTRRPSSTEADDLQPLRDAGYDDPQIFAITVFVALRLAFAYVNDALGARPDAELLAIVPTAVRDAVTFGRPTVRDRHSPRHDHR